MRLLRRLAVVLVLGCSLVGCKNSKPTAPPQPKKIVDLSPVITEDLPARQLGHRVLELLGLPSRLRFYPAGPSQRQRNFGLMLYELPSHVGAHVDAPARLLKDGARVDQIGLQKLIGTARVLDLRWKGQRSTIEPTDLENYVIEPGEIVILYVGYEVPREGEWPSYPSLSPQAAQWLAARKVKAIATDAPFLGSFQRYAESLAKGRGPEETWADRLPFFHAGIPIFEGLMNLEYLVQEKAILLIALPLPLAQRSGAPARVVAFVY